MKYDMITVGDIKLDTFVVLDEANVQCQLKMPDCLLCIDYGKKIPVNIVDSQIAGSAPNVAVGLSRMKYKTAVVSVMGKDTTEQLAMEVLKKENVDTRFIKKVASAHSSFSVVLNYKGEKTILASHLPHAYRLPNIDGPKWMYMSELGDGYQKLFAETIKKVRQHNITLGFNPGAVQLREKKRVLYDLIRASHLLIVNLEEAQMIAKEKTLEMHHLLTDLFKLGPKQVVITDGKNGAYAFDGKETFYCPIFPAKVVESTGAGDAFSTGLMGALMQGLPLSEGLRWGAVNSASVVEHVGPQKGLLTTAQIKSRLKRTSGFKVKKM